MCEYVCIYIYIYTHTDIHTTLSLYIYIYIYIYMSVCGLTLLRSRRSATVGGGSRRTAAGPRDI